MPCFPIKWQNIPHTELSLPKGKWSFPEDESFGAMMFQIVHTSREMGLTVTEFLQLPEDEKAIQMVYSNIISKIDQVNIVEQQDNLKKKPKK